jgi:hypothetical protein
LNNNSIHNLADAICGNLIKNQQDISAYLPNTVDKLKKKKRVSREAVSLQLSRKDKPGEIAPLSSAGKSLVAIKTAVHTLYSLAIQSSFS